MNLISIVDRLVGDLGDKKRWRAYRARATALPGPYRTATEGLQRYLLYAGGVAKGDVLVQMLEDLVELMEQAAADRSPIHSIVGDDPVAFADDFLTNYSDGQWVSRERARLTDSIAEAQAAEQPAAGPVA
jgi:DNA-binding ferritin-like protein (Dps family)